MKKTDIIVDKHRVYLATYISGHGLVRSLVWTLALGLNIAILFAA